jgi:hypothetical protein
MPPQTRGRDAGATQQKAAHDSVRGLEKQVVCAWQLTAWPQPFFAIFPAPPHFAQLLPAFAASTQHACAQVFPAFSALTQQPATFDSVLSAANMTPAENNDATASARNDFESFFIWFWGG